jgi:cytochrome b involved in lipid metabolism
MQPKIIILGIVGILILAGGLWAYSNWERYAPDVYVSDVETATGTQTSTIDTENDTVTPGAPTLTMTEVATHNSASSCYTVINGSVYDLTMWVNMHPGGKAPILSLCGTDGTARFTAKHGSAEKPNAALARFKIGVLGQ